MGHLGHVNRWVGWVMGHERLTHDPWTTDHDLIEIMMNVCMYNCIPYIGVVSILVYRSYCKGSLVINSNFYIFARGKPPDPQMKLALLAPVRNPGYAPGLHYEKCYIPKIFCHE